MTQYAGELTKIIHTATKDGTELTPADVTAVWISVFSGTFDPVITETEMTWDAEKDRWGYLWDTTGVDHGTYRIKVRIEGVDGGSVWEYRRVRLARDPVAA